MVTNDSYVVGALVVAKALRDLQTAYKLITLVTSDTVSEESIERLGSQYDDVISVPPISGASIERLAMTGRTDLQMTMTKLQLWSLTSFSRVLYLDADTLPLCNLDHLFTALPPAMFPFAAAPELGYPDTFNAGVSSPISFSKQIPPLCVILYSNSCVSFQTAHVINAGRKNI